MGEREFVLPPAQDVRDDPKYQAWLAGHQRQRAAEQAQREAQALQRQAAARAYAEQRTKHWSSAPPGLRAFADAALPFHAADTLDAAWAGDWAAFDQLVAGPGPAKPTEIADAVYDVDQEIVDQYRRKHPGRNLVAETLGGLARDRITGGLGRGASVVGAVTTGADGALDGAAAADPEDRGRDAAIGAVNNVGLDYVTDTAAKLLPVSPSLKPVIKNAAAAGFNDAADALKDYLGKQPARPTTPLAAGTYEYLRQRDPMLALKIPPEEQRRANWGSSYPAMEPTRRPRVEPKLSPSRRY